MSIAVDDYIRNLEEWYRTSISPIENKASMTIHILRFANAIRNTGMVVFYVFNIIDK